MLRICNGFRLKGYIPAMWRRLWDGFICDNIASMLKPCMAMRFATVNVGCKCSVQRTSPHRHVPGALELLSKEYGSIEKFLRLGNDRRMDLCAILLDLSALLLLGSNWRKRHQSWVGDSLILHPRNTKMYGVRFACWIPSAGLLWTSQCDSIYERRRRRRICYDL